jgi:CheY-like chemotaxis protein
MPPSRAIASNGAGLMALRILVVEDDALIGILLGEMLEAMGHMVCAIAATESEAVVAAAIHRPGLMIVDAQLCDGSGIRAVEQILRDGPVPHLFTSGDTLRVRKLKPDAVLIQKPFQEAELTRAIQRAVGLV